MLSLALVERELRVALRKLNPRRRRLTTAGWAVGITAFLILLSLLTGDRHVGRTVHTVLMIFGLVAVSHVPGRVAGAIAEERRNNTLGILFISGLSALDIFVGKLFSAVLIAFNDLLVIFPMLALPFVMGGVSFQLFIATVCCLPNVLLFVLATSMFASTVTMDEASSRTLTTLLLVIICGLAPLLWLGQQWFGGATAQSSWFMWSPGYGVYLVFQKFSGVSAHTFWLNSLVTLGWSVALLTAAAGSLQRIWRRDEAAVHQQKLPGWRELFEEQFNRQRAANRWMIEANPSLWAEIADTRPLKRAWLGIGAVIVLWLAGFAAWPAHWAGPVNFYITTLLLIGIVQTIQNHATAVRFANSRRDGAFELLLTTPHSTEEIVEGHFEGRRVQFRPVVRLLLMLEVVMATAGLLTRPLSPLGHVTYWCIWAVLGLWTWSLRGNGVGSVRVAWTALNSARVTFAMRGNSSGWGSWWTWGWLLWNARRGLGLLNDFPTGSVVEVVIVGFVTLMVFLLNAAKFAGTNPQTRRLITEFREIIREPIPDPDDPRYKNWQALTERFPWGTAGFQDQVIERNARRRQERAKGS